MGTIAEKLTYLNTTKEKIRDSINLTGANIGTSDTFRSYASKLKLGYIDIINNGIDTLYNNFPKVSGIGSNLSLTPTYEAPMKLNEIQGDTLQDGTPTPDTPVPIQSVTGLQNIEVCGKNLLNLGTKSFTTYYQESNIYIPAGTYTMSAKITSEDTQYPESRAYFYNGNTQVAMFTLNRNTRSSATKTLSTSADRIIIYSSIDYSSSNGKNATWKDVQLEKGSSSTTYEPYKGNTYEVNLGKNLLKFPYTESTLTRDGITYTINNDGSIKISGTATSQSYIDLYRNTNVNLLEKGNTYTYSISPENSNIRLQFYERYNNAWNDKGYGTNKITFTISDNSEGQMIRLLVVNGSTIDTTISPQIEKGTEATSYSPYFTPIELNKIGTYQDSIKKSNGKNLLDLSKCITGYIDANGRIVTSDPSNLLTDYIKVQSGNNYTISLNTQFSNIGYALFDSSKTYISRQNNSNKTTMTITIPSNAEYLRIWFNYNGTTTLTPINILTYQPMINEGSTALPYEPYGKVWYIEKQVGKVVLDGTEAWGYDSNSLFFVSSNAISNYSRSNNIPYCDYYKGVSNVNGGGNINNNEIAFNNNVSNNRLYVKNTNITSASDFKTWLSTHNTEVLYVLATPEYTEITNTELIEDLETLYTAKSQEGTTNISITSEDLEMILNVSALKGEV